MLTTYLAFSLSFLSTAVGIFVIAQLCARQIRRTYDKSELPALLKQTGKRVFALSFAIFLIFGIFVDVPHSFLQSGLGVVLVWLYLYAKRALSNALNCR
ncbi:MAG: hypothetical protein K2Y32_14995 [Candidatus Obscuribacterales bacterium]|nr:hypothetical protein [Candidatus Obscuribacterales bacterium]